ncbi:MAG TPA: Asp-tRNA(Asn)/Glu-tRNA(Gln) amidotransferase subunit GatB [Polyangiaceae bacterium]
MTQRYEPVIGLEVHAQLMTRSKLFCGCSTEFGHPPNHNVCAVCLGLPGSLPVLNRQAVAMSVRVALALDCTIIENSIFARKNYFYPDLPKGYQISQYEEPFSRRGKLEVEVGETTRRVGIHRVHMEEDAGKTVHAAGMDSLVDLNRAGVPLVEIVSEPDLRSSAEAAAYLKSLREVLMFIGVNDGNLEEGSFRCDANVSIRPQGAEILGTRCELKNLNSFRFVQRAIDSEVSRQTAILDGGGAVEQETRSFDPNTGKTHSLRSKEEAHDYRYFPEPDLPPLYIGPELVAQEAENIGELPAAIRRRWVQKLGLSAAAALTLTQHPEYVRFFECALALYPDPVRLANWMQTEVLRGAKTHGLRAEFSVSPEQVAELLRCVERGAISGKQAKQVFAELENTHRTPGEIVEKLGLSVESDAGELTALCQKLVEEHPTQAASVRAGKKNVLGFFVGQVMKETRGSADPRLVTQILESMLGGH